MWRGLYPIGRACRRGVELRVIEWITDTVGCAPGGVNIGVVRVDEDGAILIDTGLNDSAVRKVLRSLQNEQRQVRAIITTHCHADHFGGNAFTVRRTDARVFAPAWDEAVLRYPMFQPVCLFAGADPPAFYLLHPTVFAYLTYLELEGAVTHTIEKGHSVWRRS